MGDGDRDAAAGAQVVLQPGQGGAVEVVGGLVEEQHLRGGGEQDGEAQAYGLAAGQAADGALAGQGRQAEAVQGTLHAGVRVVPAAQFEGGEGVRVRGEGLGGGVAVGHAGLQPAQLPLQGTQSGEGAVDHLLDGQVRGEVLLLREVADAAFGAQDDLAAVGALGPGQQPEQGGLARAVLSDDAEAFAGGDGAVDGVEDQAAPVGLGEVRRGELCSHRAAPGGRGRGVSRRRCGGRQRGGCPREFSFKATNVALKCWHGFPHAGKRRFRPTGTGREAAPDRRPERPRPHPGTGVGGHTAPGIRVRRADRRRGRRTRRRPPHHRLPALARRRAPAGRRTRRRVRRHVEPTGRRLAGGRPDRPQPGGVRGTGRRRTEPDHGPDRRRIPVGPGRDGAVALLGGPLRTVCGGRHPGGRPG